MVDWLPDSAVCVIFIYPIRLLDYHDHDQLIRFSSRLIVYPAGFKSKSIMSIYTNLEFGLEYGVWSLEDGTFTLQSPLTGQHHQHQNQLSMPSMPSSMLSAVESRSC